MVLYKLVSGYFLYKGVEKFMGKDLKGKELGEGISQRKDGRYSVRISDGKGKRVQKYFSKLQEARKWKATAEYDFKVLKKADSTLKVDQVAKQMLKLKKQKVKYTSYMTIETCYKTHIENEFKGMEIGKVKPMHIERFMAEKAVDYRKGTLNLIRTVLGMIFNFAIDNQMIVFNPVTRSTFVKSKVPKKEVKALTIEQQRKFVEWCKMKPGRNKYLFALQTGLRAGELSALQWSDIDMQKATMFITRNMAKRNENGKYVPTEIGVKTENSEREIPLTKEAIRILKEQRQKNMVSFNYVFMSQCKTPVSSVACDKELRSIRDELGVKVLSMHVLRHTFATRCIEAGMNPKTLQHILGHSNISTTLDLYVHVTDNEKRRQIEMTEQYLNVI